MLWVSYIRDRRLPVWSFIILEEEPKSIPWTIGHWVRFNVWYEYVPMFSTSHSYFNLRLLSKKGEFDTNSLKKQFRPSSFSSNYLLKFVSFGKKFLPFSHNFLSFAKTRNLFNEFRFLFKVWRFGIGCQVANHVCFGANV